MEKPYIILNSAPYSRGPFIPNSSLSTKFPEAIYRWFYKVIRNEGRPFVQKNTMTIGIFGPPDQIYSGTVYTGTLRYILPVAWHLCTTISQ